MMDISFITVLHFYFSIYSFSFNSSCYSIFIPTSFNSLFVKYKLMASFKIYNSTNFAPSDSMLKSLRAQNAVVARRTLYKRTSPIANFSKCFILLINLLQNLLFISLNPVSTSIIHFKNTYFFKRLRALSNYSNELLSVTPYEFPFIPLFTISNISLKSSSSYLRRLISK